MFTYIKTLKCLYNLIGYLYKLAKRKKKVARKWKRLFSGKNNNLWEVLYLKLWFYGYLKIYYIRLSFLSKKCMKVKEREKKPRKQKHME
jgi:hypothetical protein